MKRDSIQAKLETRLKQFLGDLGLGDRLSGREIRMLAKNLTLTFVFHGDEDEDWYDLYDMGGGLTLKTHPRNKCEGRPCCIHNPSDHWMSSWPQSWDSRNQVMSRVCEHNFTHPDPDDITVRDNSGWTHICDGCCSPDVVVEYQDPSSLTWGINPSSN